MAKLKDLKVGDKVVDPNTTYYDQPIVWVVADKNHAGYPADSVTLISEKILCLKAFDGKEAKNSNSDRRSYGNNHYKNSNILQWLNSDKKSWYTAQHPADAPPNSSNTYYNPYESEPGFLTGFSADFKAALLETTLKTVRHRLDGGGSENVKSKIFLASTTEVGLANEAGIAEGSKLALFYGITSRRAKPTPEAVNKSSFSASVFNANDPWFWYLRTLNTSISYHVRYVNTTGTLSNIHAYHGAYGVRPLCNLPDNVSVNVGDVNELSFGLPIKYKDGNTIKNIENAYYKDSNGVLQPIANVYYKDSIGEIKNLK